MPQTNILFLLCMREKEIKDILIIFHRGVSMICKQEPWDYIQII